MGWGPSSKSVFGTNISSSSCCGCGWGWATVAAAKKSKQQKNSISSTRIRSSERESCEFMDQNWIKLKGLLCIEGELWIWELHLTVEESSESWVVVDRWIRDWKRGVCNKLCKRKERKRWNGMGDEQRKEKKKLTDSLGLVRDQKIKEDTFGIYYQIMATNRRFFFFFWGLKFKIFCLNFFFFFFFFHISFQFFKFQIYLIKIFSLTFINFFKKKSGKIFLIINWIFLI